MPERDQRDRLALIAGAILTTIALPIVFAQKWGEKNPYILTVLGTVAVVLYLGYAFTSPSFVAMARRLDARKPMVALSLFVFLGGAIGSALGWLAWLGVHANKAHLQEIASREVVPLTAEAIAEAISRKTPPAGASSSRAGNLKDRALTLADEIEGSLGLIPMPPGGSDALQRWVQTRSDFFMFRYFARVRKIRDEFALIHEREERLDDLIQRVDAMRDKRFDEAHPAAAVLMSPLSPLDIRGVAESLRRMAARLD